MTTPAAPAVLTAPQKPAPTTDAGTEYVILVQGSTASANTISPSAKPGTWTLEGRVTARDASAAIEKYAAANGNKPGTFVAIAASKWKPIRVTPETVTTLKLEDAK